MYSLPQGSIDPARAVHVWPEKKSKLGDCDLLNFIHSHWKYDHDNNDHSLMSLVLRDQPCGHEWFNSSFSVTRH